LSIKPKQPYIDWANALDENIYLIDDIPEGSLNPEALFEACYAAIFDE
jgi:hypothetical protein